VLRKNGAEQLTNVSGLVQVCPGGSAGPGRRFIAGSRWFEGSRGCAFWRLPRLAPEATRG
jgi:hypothetical protein